MDIRSILKSLSKKRPIFHSEADFQHALAWEIQRKYPGAKIRLELHPKRLGAREYLDILVEYKGKTYAIELKYKTKKLSYIDKDDEEFNLLNQSAQDIGRYDFIKDVVRLEGFVKKHKNSVGYAIILTNDRGYWRQSNRDTVDSDFRIHEAKELRGSLKWDIRASEGTRRGRDIILKLNGFYTINWNHYSDINNSEFKYALVEICAQH